MKNTIKKVIEDSYKYNLGHIPSALSVLPIVKNLYESSVRYPIVLGKSFGLQAWFIDETVEEIYKKNRQYKILTPEFFSNSVFDVVYTQQQLGLAAGYAVGYSIANNIPVICILSDGDFFLSSTISAIDTAIRFNTKVHFIIDHNNVQLFSERSIEHMKFHNVEYTEQYRPEEYDYTKPKILCVNTIKGYGCTVLEERPKDWHYRKISDITELEYLLANVS